MFDAQVRISVDMSPDLWSLAVRREA